MNLGSSEDSNKTIPQDTSILVPLPYQEYNLYCQLLKQRQPSQEEQPLSHSPHSPPSPPPQIDPHPLDEEGSPSSALLGPTSESEPVTSSNLEEENLHANNIAEADASCASTDRRPESSLQHFNEKVPEEDFQTQRSKNLPPWSSSLSAKKKGSRSKKKQSTTPQGSGALIEAVNAANLEKSNLDFTEQRGLPSWTSERPQPPKVTSNEERKSTPNSMNSLDNVINHVKSQIPKSSVKSLHIFQKKLKHDKALTKKLLRFEQENLKSLLTKSFSKKAKNKEIIDNEVPFLKQMQKSKLLYLLPNVCMIQVLKPRPWYKIF